VSEPILLSREEVMCIHARSLTEHGGSEGVRDPGLIDSALASAKNAFYDGEGDVFDVAASYAFHLAEAQAFLDGNKRTAVAVALIFLARNGSYVTPPARRLYQAMIDVAEKRLRKTGLAAFFREMAGGPPQ
jgi:death-on-curing protein